MANQPKKYKKFVATAATATLVASAIVPVASAAGFTDVANNSHEEAINALADAGIINGYADGTFKPNQTINRGQVVKLLGRWLETEGFEAPADWDTKQRFNDLPLTAEKELVKYAALAKDAGVFAGSNGNLNHTQTMQRQQMAVVLVRAINEIYELDLVKEYKAAKFTSEISDLDKAFSAEQREAITALEYAELTNAANLPGKAFNPANSITRGQFASFLYRTINLEVQSKASVKAINNTTVEVTFDKEVDDVQALKFEIKDLEVKNAAVKQTDKKVVVLTTAAQTADKEYTVSSNGEEIGKFKGVSAVVPTKVELVEKSTQGKLGQQVTLKAQVTVAEGQSKANIPVTFFIPGSANGVKAPVTVEAQTNEEGIATYTYTRYAATNDTVTAYATGDRSKFSTGYVFWAVDQTLTITEVTEGATINNGANKVYKVTYKDPETGKPVSGKTLNVSVKENIDVTVDKLQNVTVNGTQVVQTSDTNTKAAQIKTDSKGEATFTVTGSNAEVTPVVFDAAAITNSSNVVTSYTQKYTADTLQATASKVKFGAQQADYTIDVTRDGNETAATGVSNGRKYKVVVKTKDGKLAANETVNVAFNEDLDGVISTTTDAKFVKVENDGSQKDFDYAADKNAKKITVKTNSKGEASFVIGTEAGKVNTYATPIAWIDINNHTGKDANLDKGEPNAIAPISYFQAEYIDGAKLAAKNKDGKDATEFEGQPATFKVVLVNQSGKEMKEHGYSLDKTAYTIFNDGANNIKVGNEEIAPNRSYNVTSGDSIEVSQVNGKASSVKVTATGVAKKTESNGVVKDFSFTSKDATAKFLDSKELTNPYTGIIDLNSIDKDEKEIKFSGKDKAIAYAGESGKTYKYLSGTSTIAGEKAFIELLEEYKAAGKTVRVTYEVKDDVVTFTIVSVNEGNGSGTAGSVVDKINAATTLAQVESALANYPAYQSLLAADKTKVASDIFDEVKVKPITSAGLANYFATPAPSIKGATFAAATPGTPGVKASAEIANLLKVTAKADGAELNGVEIVVVDTKNNQKVETVLTPAEGATKAKLTIDVANKSEFDKTVVTTLADIKEAIEAKLPVTVELDKNVTSTDVVDVTKFAGLTLDKGAAAVVASNSTLELTFSHNVTLGSKVVLDIDGTEVTATTATIKEGTDKNVVVLTFATAPAATTTVKVKDGVTVNGYTIAADSLTSTITIK